MPKFHVIETFVLESRSWFVLAGSIAEGEVKPGMHVRIPFNPALSMTAPIDSIEFTLRSGGAEDTCLCIRYADDDELSLWRGLNIGGEVLEVDAKADDMLPRGAA